MNAVVKRAARLIAGAQIADIRLVEGICRTKIRHPKNSGEVRIELDFTAKAGARSTRNLLVFVSFKLLVNPAEETGKPLVEVKARFELTYSLPNDIDFSNAEAKAFSQVNGVFNSWPYFREYAQSSLRRMNMPSIVMPLYRLEEFVPSAKAAGKRSDVAGEEPSKAD